MSGADKHEHTVVFLVAPGDVLDERWEIEARVGQGAMGSVFRGRDLETDDRVAVKILAPEHCRKPKVLARFEREAELMMELRHPNIIQLFGMGHRGALPYIVMQYLEGMTLADVLKRQGGKLTAGETMAVVKQVSSGLSFIHHHKLVHRDIKPQNVFVSPGGRVTILDLGVVRDRSNPGLTKPGAMVGTPYYMSPEQIAGVTEIDKRTDVYALAAMTFELLVGRPPFLGSNNFEVLYAHKNTPVPDASVLTKGVSKDVAKVLMRGMAKSPNDRPQSASEFYADLEAYFGSAATVDPKHAFAWLQPEGAGAGDDDDTATKDDPRQKKPTSLARAGVSPSGKQPQLGRGPLGTSGKHPTNAGRQPVIAPPVKPSTRARTLALEQVGLGTGRTNSREIPMARSSDVELIQSGIEAASSSSETPAPGPDQTDEPSDVKPSPNLTGRDTDVREATRIPRRGQTHAATVEDADATMTESGELRVVTTLKGLTASAQLFIDDKPVGQTPRSLAVPAGPHVVRVERAGAKSVRKEVTVPANQVTLVRLELVTAK